MARTTRSAFGRDAGLKVRMLVTLMLLGAVYVAFVAILAAGAGTRAERCG